MNYKWKASLGILLLLILSLQHQHGYAQSSPLRVWYKQPALQWEECIPLGNGRLGAMPDGGITKEKIVLNDITLWSGAAQEADAPDASGSLPQIRQLLLEGKNDEAEALTNKTFICKGQGSGMGSSAHLPYGSYQLLGNLTLNYDYGLATREIHPTAYTRELLLPQAVARTSFALDGTTYTREYFTSFDSDVIIIRLSADKPAKMNFSIALDRPEKFRTQLLGDELQMTGQLDNGTDGQGMKYMTRIKVKTEGGLIITKGQLAVEKANTVTLYISNATNFRQADYLKTSAQQMQDAYVKRYVDERKRHVDNFQRLFNRTQLVLGDNSNDELPTDKRIEAFAKNPSDADFAALYFQFGRYLAISSTRIGLLPPNLQGLWANTIQTPWNGDYHLNINIQMNHWPLHITNLAELNEPFLHLIESLVKPGEKTASLYYGAPSGWVAHTITNIWGYTSPGESADWGAFNTGSAWSCQMLWTHYEFTRDKAYLEQLYPILKGSALFYLNTLITDPATGWLVTAPSNSPENGFKMSNGNIAHVCMGPTIDNQIIRALFGYVIEASKELQTDPTLREQLQQMSLLLPPNQIGKDGRLMEWLKEYTEVEPDHRHVSHLWGLYPGSEITPEKTPDLAIAARATLDGRGDFGTGWSLAWKINMWARLYDGERAFKVLQRFLRPTLMQGFNMHDGGGIYPNLFCAHPPYQIDGNFGTTAGIAEMLLQSHNEYVALLPALPEAWATGYFNGMCIRGGATVDARWKDKRLATATLHATLDQQLLLKIPPHVKTIIIRRNGKSQKLPLQSMLKLDLKTNEPTELIFQY